MLRTIFALMVVSVINISAQGDQAALSANALVSEFSWSHEKLNVSLPSAVNLVAQVASMNTAPISPIIPPLPGDVDFDGAVDARDALMMFADWGLNPRSGADLNDDGLVDAADAGIMFANWTGDVASIPEPSTAYLGAMGTAWLLLRRRLHRVVNFEQRFPS